jgi:signal transduction histidine kinase
MVYEITNYQPFLLRKIIPQILFGLLLLLLTGFAFIFTYRSLKRQMLLNTLRNEFISNVSHELKTPVSTVKVALEALQNYDQKKDKSISEEYLKMASLEMDRLDLLIQKILNQSLLESRQMMVKTERIDLIRIIITVLESFRPRLDAKNGKIFFNPDVEEAEIQLDPLYIQGVLINLLDNALKYGGDPPIITVSYRENHKMAFVDVADNGEGIPKEYQDKIFERFFRIPTDNKHNVKGYGLGLSFAAEVMEQHKGWIKVQSNPDGGSIFTLGFNKTNND